MSQHTDRAERTLYRSYEYFANGIISYIDKKLEQQFGKFTVTRGDTHKFLVINIKLRKDRKIELDIIEQIKEIINDFSVKWKVT